MNELETLQRTVDKAASLYQQAADNADQEEKRLQQADENLCNTQEAQEILQIVSKAVQEEVHNRIASVVSSCL